MSTDRSGVVNIWLSMRCFKALRLLIYRVEFVRIVHLILEHCLSRIVSEKRIVATFTIFENIICSDLKVYLVFC